VNVGLATACQMLRTWVGDVVGERVGDPLGGRLGTCSRQHGSLDRLPVTYTPVCGDYDVPLWVAWLAAPSERRRVTDVVEVQRHERVERQAKALSVSRCKGLPWLGERLAHTSEAPSAESLAAVTWMHNSSSQRFSTTEARVSFRTRGFCACISKLWKVKPEKGSCFAYIQHKVVQYSREEDAPSKEPGKGW
jgi:hypothetical protein